MLVILAIFEVMNGLSLY